MGILDAAARTAVIAAFEASGGTDGHRRIASVVDVGERTVRGIEKNESLITCAATAPTRARHPQCPRTCCATSAVSTASAPVSVSVKTVVS